MARPHAVPVSGEGSVSRGSRCSLIQLEGFLSALCCSCEAAHRVLYWENPAVSSQ